MDVEGQKNVLLDAIQQQYQDEVAATEANRRLADEQISYTNEAKGTYYSGIPTWQRAQLAVNYGDKMNTLNKNLLSAQENVWNTVSNYLDRINAYKSAAGGSGGGSTPSQSKYSTDLNTYYSDARGYQFVDPNGNPVTAATWARGTGQNVWDVIGKMASKGDFNATRALAGYKNANKQLTDEESRAFEILGLSTTGYGRRD